MCCGSQCVLCIVHAGPSIPGSDHAEGAGSEKAAWPSRHRRLLAGTAGSHYEQYRTGTLIIL